MKPTELKRKTRLSQGQPPKRGGPLPPVNRARRAKRFIANYGTLERVLWFIDQPCACEGKHPACTRGASQNSHTVSKAHAGKAENIIPQSPGCHGYAGTQGWDRWEREVAEALGMHAPFVVEDDRGYRLDRHAMAEAFAQRGPDAPGVSS